MRYQVRSQQVGHLQPVLFCNHTGHVIRHLFIQGHINCAWEGWQQQGYDSLFNCLWCLLALCHHWQRLPCYVLPHPDVRVSYPPCVHFQYLLPLISCMTKHRRQPSQPRYGPCKTETASPTPCSAQTSELTQPS